MDKLRLLKISSVVVLASAASACSLFNGLDTPKHAKARTAVSTPPSNRVLRVPLAKTSNKVLGNQLKIYFGSLNKPVVAKAKRKAVAIAQSGKKITVDGANYYTSQTVLDKTDVKRTFVAKTEKDQPALALRLTLSGLSKLKQARQGHYNVILGSINGSFFSKTVNSESNLTDNVLLLPMPTLVSARDAADMLR